MPQLSHAARLAQEAIEISSAGEVPGTRDLDGHHAVEFSIMSFVDGAERALPHRLQQFKSAETLAHGLGPRGRRAVVRLKARTARRTGNLVPLRALAQRFDNFNGIAAVRAGDVHGSPSKRSQPRLLSAAEPQCATARS